MARPIGSVNRERPFNSALLIELRSNPLALRRIAAKLVGRAEAGDLGAIKEIADRLDGKPMQMVDYGNLTVNQLSDEQLLEIAAGGLTERDCEPKALPAPRKLSAP
jgi:hypothetical protein